MSRDLDEKVIVTTVDHLRVAVGLVGTMTGAVEMTRTFTRTEALELAERIKQAAGVLSG